ncbi:MAG: gfo/Idh/MocA family oxidoreductase [Actinobacteria bacterium]|nr:gfo/Idh/MocA family oxidoreductase [Actinomycetota bacterium]
MTLRWGILSTAAIGRSSVIPGTQAADRCEVVAVGSRDADAATAFASELGLPRSHGSYEALLADPEVDAVYIPLPNHLHAEWTIAAARAGKHVLCEKPIAMTAAEARSMVEVCDAEGVLLMEAFMYRLHPIWEATRELVASGRIGTLRSVQSWFSYFNDDPANIRNIREAGGGALFDIGCYCVNVSRMLFGSEPQEILASVEIDPATNVDVLTSAILEFEGGTAAFTCSTRTESDQRVHIYGTEGRITIPIPFNIASDPSPELRLIAGGDPPAAPNEEVFTFDPISPYQIQAERFAAAILDGASLPTPTEDAIANMAVIDQIFAAGQ